MEARPPQRLTTPRQRSESLLPFRAGRCRFRARAFVGFSERAESAPRGAEWLPQSREEPQVSKFLFLYRGPAMPMEDFTPE